MRERDGRGGRVEGGAVEVTAVCMGGREGVGMGNDETKKKRNEKKEKRNRK